jgi:glycosyltransferase involved in cell wall biosynthesis
MAGDDRYDLVWFWKQNDSGLYGRRQDHLLRVLAASPRVRRIVHFDRPVPVRDLFAGARFDRHPLQRHENRVLLQTLPRFRRRVERGKVTRHTFLFADERSPLLGRVLPGADGYVAFVRRILAKAGVGPARTVFWVCPRNASFPRLVRRLAPALAVADCIDDHRAWPDATPAFIEKVQQNYRDVLGCCDLVLANGTGMRDALAEFGHEVEIVESGYESVDRDAACPPDLARIARPIVGYAGNLSARIDVALLRRLAERRPAWNLVLIGAARPGDAIHTLADLPNVHLLGVRPHAQIGAYVRHFDVAIVPHLDDALTRSMAPLKVGLYCAAGVPVVSTRVANLGALADEIEIAADAADFEAKVARALAEPLSAERCARRDAILRANGWEARAVQILDLLDAAWDHKWSISAGERDLSTRPPS